MENQQDKQLGVDVFNGFLEAALRSYREQKTSETLNIVLNQLHDARILVLGFLVQGNKTQLICIGNEEGDKYIPVFTSKEQIPEGNTFPIMNVSYHGVNRTVAEDESDIKGIVFNPYTPDQNLTFNKHLIRSLAEEEAQRGNPAYRR